MTTKIQKWGNSLAVRLPQHVITKLNLKKGSPVMIEEKSGRMITIIPVMKKNMSLDELVRKITPQNKHEEVDWGDSVGNELL